MLSILTLVHAQAGYTPFSVMGASSVMVAGKFFYIQGGLSNGQAQRVTLRQTFSINLSGTWNISHPPYTAMADGVDDSYYPGTLLNDDATWFMIHRNRTIFHYNLATQTISPKGLIANYSSIEGLNAFVDPKTNNVIVPNGYRGQSGPITTLNISPTSLLSQQLASLPGTDGLQYYASAWSASEGAYYAFGGWNQVYSNSLVRFDVASNKWSNITAPGSPTARDVACMAAAYGGTKLVLFGGEALTGKEVLSEIYIFDVVRGTWLKGPDGGPSRARSGGVCGVSGDSLVLWGGYTNMETRGPVQEILSVYNLKTNTWQQGFNDLGNVNDGSGSRSGNGTGPVPNPPPGAGPGPNVAAIVGGVAAVVVIVAAVVFILYRRKKAKGVVPSSQPELTQRESSGPREDNDSQWARQPLAHSKQSKVEEPGYGYSSTKPRNPALVSKQEDNNVKGWSHQQYPVKNEHELDNQIEAQIEHLQTLMAQKNAVGGQRSPPGPQSTWVLLVVTFLSLMHAALAQVFQNTPGLAVGSPTNGQTVAQDQSLPLSAQLTARRVIGSYSVSIAKADGSGNTTLAQKTGVSTLRIVDVWEVASSHLDLGDYVVQFTVTANTSIVIPPPVVAPSGGASSMPTRVVTTTTALATGTPRPPVPGVPTVYYWRGAIKIVGPGKGSDAMGLMHGQSVTALFKKTLLAFGVVALGYSTL
ncbi:hypothetical protein BGZ74_011537 [Mortierella antarctica]|nr:hypothetical protein BGZ74_011537 [Mortierella antarctica]